MNDQSEGIRSQICTVERPPDAPAVAFAKAADLIDASVFVIVGMRSNAGIGECKVKDTERNLIPFLRASVEMVSLAAEDFTSWLLAEQEFERHPVVYRYWGRLWTEVIDLP